MLERLIGVETEFAIRFSPVGRSKKPDNDVIYDHVIGAIKRFVSTGRGDYTGKKQVFVQNGGAFNYEHLPYAIDGGLMEACTPECRSPLQALTYQRAMEGILVKALPEAERSLRNDGFYGSLGLLKNCRDAEGHVYGTQENYEAIIGEGPYLWVYRLAVAAVFPLILLLAPITWALILPFGLFVFLISLAIVITDGASSKPEPTFDEIPKSVKGFLNKMGYFDIGFMYLWSPILIPFLFLLRLVAFRRQRKILLPFLITRQIVSGAGCLTDKGYLLSEKANAINGLIRTGGHPRQKPVFEISNLMKLLFKPVYFQMKPYFALFRKRQRLHLNLSDSNMCQTAEYLKIGTTALVLDMAESGFLKKIPRFGDPIRALKEINRALAEQDESENSIFSDALAVQREYHKQAVEFVSQSDYTSIEAREIVRTWGRVLDMLEKSPDLLWGKIDWVTKRQILNSIEDENDWNVLKKIDLKYHELDSGYHANLENAGESLIIIDNDDIETAIFHPPEETPAYFRGEIIKALTKMDKSPRFSWTMRPPGKTKKGVLVDFKPRHKK